MADQSQSPLPPMPPLPRPPMTPPMVGAAVLVLTVLIAWGFHALLTRGQMNVRVQGTPNVQLPPPEDIDWAAVITNTSDEMVTEGEGVYQRVCLACHALDGGEGNLATARQLAHQPLQNGEDLWSIYGTIMNGYNAMPAQRQLSSREALAAAHFVQERFLRDNPNVEYIAPDEEYLATIDLPESSAAADGGRAGAPPPMALEVPIYGVAVRQADTVDDVAQRHTDRLFFMRCARSERPVLHDLSRLGDTSFARPLVASLHGNRYDDFRTVLVNRVAPSGLGGTRFAAMTDEQLRQVFAQARSVYQQVQQTEADAGHGHDHAHDQAHDHGHGAL